MMPYAEVIGDPIAQSKSPAIHRGWLAGRGIDADYRRAHVRAPDLADYIAARRGDPAWRGCNVTMPHKLAVMPLLDRIDDLAARVGAVNTVVRGADGTLTGYNTDVPGFMEPLVADGHHTQGERALVLGAGGAARAVIVGLVDAGMRLTVAARDPARAQGMLDGLTRHGEPMLAADLARFSRSGQGGFDLVVNASPLGMVGNPALDFDLSHVAAGGTVYDIITAPLITPLLAGAAARGLRVVDGLAMLIGQADVAFAHFYGVAPDRRDGDAALRAVLTA